MHFNHLKGLLFFLSILTLFSGCQRKSYEFISSWNSKGPLIDSKLDEWQLPLEQPAAQIPIKYRCSNDDKYLYIAIQAGDEYMKALFLHQGAKIWIDSTARRKEKFGIAYPLPLKETEIEAIAAEAAGNEQKFMQLYAEAMQEFDIYGLADESLRLSNLTSKDLKVALGFDQLNTLCMEMRIPLKTAFPNGSTEKIFSLGIIINNPKKSLEDESNDGSIFNDRNQSGVTQSNPLLGPNTQQMNQGPSRQLSMPNIWMKVKLSAGQ